MSLSWEDIWSEHRRLIIAAGTGLALFLIGLSWVRSIEATAHDLERQSLQLERQVEALAGELEGREGYEAGLARALQETVGPSVRGAVEWPVREAFRLEDDESPFIRYHEALRRVEGEQARARRQGVTLPGSLGLIEQPPEDRVGEQLALLDLCERLLAELTELEVPTVAVFRGREVEYALLGDARGEGEAPAHALRRLPVELAIVAPLDTVEALLAQLQRPGSALEVSKLRLTRARDELLRLEVELAALALVDAAEAPQAAGRRDGATPGDRLIRRRAQR